MNTDTTESTTPRRRVGGRSAHVTQRVHNVMRQLLIDGDRSAINVSNVAERADVAPSTIYRRWGDLANLELEVALEIAESQMPGVDTGSLPTDLLVFTRQAIAFIGSPTGNVLIRGWLTTDPEGLRNYWARRWMDVRAPFDRAIERGELAADAPVVEALENHSGSLYFKVLFSGKTLDPEDAARSLVEVALRTVGHPVPDAWRSAKSAIHRPTA